MRWKKEGKNIRDTNGVVYRKLGGGLIFIKGLGGGGGGRCGDYVPAFDAKYEKLLYAVHFICQIFPPNKIQ